MIWHQWIDTKLIEVSLIFTIFKMSSAVTAALKLQP